MRLQELAGVVLFGLTWAVLIMTIVAFVNAAMQRPDAYTAADKQTKPVWLLILGVAGLLCYAWDVMGPTIAAVAAGVYLVDVRPRLLEIQGKSR